MSESPQDPDWWLASDGKWYPPQSHVPPPPPPPPPPSSEEPVPFGWWLASDGRWYPPPAASATTHGPAGSASPPLPARRAVSGGLSGTLQGFLWVAAALSVVATILSLVGLAAFNDWWNAPDGSRAEAVAFDDMIAADDGINSVVGFVMIVGVVVAVLLMIWTYHSSQATLHLWQGDRKWSTGWAVGAWFIPFANAVIPKLVLSEIERIALADRSGGLARPNWTERSTLTIGWLWWVTFVVGATIGIIGFGLFDDPGGSPESWRAGYWLTAVGAALQAISGVLGALYVRQVGRALSSQSMAHTI